MTSSCSRNKVLVWIHFFNGFADGTEKSNSLNDFVWKDTNMIYNAHKYHWHCFYVQYLTHSWWYVLHLFHPSICEASIYVIHSRYSHIPMAQCKTAVTPLQEHWSYCSSAMSHRFNQKANVLYIQGIAEYIFDAYLVHKRLFNKVQGLYHGINLLTHWGQVTHASVN